MFDPLGGAFFGHDGRKSLDFGQDGVGLDPDAMTPQDGVGFALPGQSVWDAAFSIHVWPMPTIPQWHHDASLKGTHMVRFVKS